MTKPTTSGWITTTGPDQYHSGPGVLKQIGKAAADLGKHAFIIAGARSLETTKDTIYQSLDATGIAHTTVILDGYPNERHKDLFLKEAKEAGADFFIAIGGGRAVDITKFTAFAAGKRLISVPTVSATNAPWRARSILYDDEGHHAGRSLNEHNPYAIFADSEVLAQQPVRYIEAGAIDTLGRWYEFRPYTKLYPDSLHLRYAFQTINLAHDTLLGEASEFLEDVRARRSSKAVIDAVDSIIALGGLCSDVSSDLTFQGLAHPFYYSVTRFRKDASATENLLHGEIIGYGVLVQLILEGRPEEEWKREFQNLSTFQCRYTLEDMGVDTEDRLNQVVDDLWSGKFPKIPFLAHVQEKSQLKDAILRINELMHWE